MIVISRIILLIYMLRLSPHTLTWMLNLGVTLYKRNDQELQHCTTIKPQNENPVFSSCLCNYLFL